MRKLTDFQKLNRSINARFKEMSEGSYGIFLTVPHRRLGEKFFLALTERQKALCGQAEIDFINEYGRLVVEKNGGFHSVIFNEATTPPALRGAVGVILDVVTKSSRLTAPVIAGPKPMAGSLQLLPIKDFPYPKDPDCLAKTETIYAQLMDFIDLIDTNQPIAVLQAKIEPALEDAMVKRSFLKGLYQAKRYAEGKEHDIVNLCRIHSVNLARYAMTNGGDYKRLEAFMEHIEYIRSRLVDAAPQPMSCEPAPNQDEEIEPARFEQRYCAIEELPELVWSRDPLLKYPDALKQVHEVREISWKAFRKLLTGKDRLFIRLEDRPYREFVALTRLKDTAFRPYLWTRHNFGWFGVGQSQLKHWAMSPGWSEVLAISYTPDLFYNPLNIQPYSGVVFIPKGIGVRHKSKSWYSPGILQTTYRQHLLTIQEHLRGQDLSFPEGPLACGLLCIPGNQTFARLTVYLENETTVGHYHITQW